jgi:hypothetical protein
MKFVYFLLLVCAIRTPAQASDNPATTGAGYTWFNSPSLDKT